MGITPADAVDEVTKAVVGARKPRPGLTEAVELASRGHNVILSAPTGYGKTTIPYSLGLLSATSSRYSLSTYHVLPMRSIIQDVWSRLFRDGLEPRHECLTRDAVGRQMMGLSESPNLQKPLVITTMDTFLLTLLRVPPEDLKRIWRGVSLGHGEYSRAIITASTVVIDEIQLLAEDEDVRFDVVMEVLKWLYRHGCTVVVMSATLPDQLLEALRGVAGEEVKILRYGAEFRDEEFEAARLSNRVETLPVKGDLVKESRDLVCEANYDKTAVILNTVDSLVRIAEDLRSRCEGELIILHAGLKASDREERLERIKKSKRFTLVSTQVVEAGVDASFNAMVSDASTPSSLVQRAGRLLRHEEGERGLLKIVYDERQEGQGRYAVYPLRLVQETMEVLRGLRGRGEDLVWHLPSVGEGVGYERFMSECYSRTGFRIYDGKESREAHLAHQILSNLLVDSRKTIDELLLSGRGVLRDSNMILGVVEEEGVDVTKLPESQLLPLNESRLRLVYDYCKDKGGVKGLCLDKTGESLELRNATDEVRKMLVMRGRGFNPFKLWAVVVPGELYDDVYGLAPGARSS